MAARNMGIPVRPMIVLRYVISALIAFAAGLLTASSLHEHQHARGQFRRCSTTSSWWW